MQDLCSYQQAKAPSIFMNANKGAVRAGDGETAHDQFLGQQQLHVEERVRERVQDGGQSDAEKLERDLRRDRD